MSKYANLFTKQSALYARYRPDYPRELYKIIFDRLPRRSSNHKNGYAIDVATGTGQVAREIRENFDNVLATDISEQQLQQAAQFDNVSYVQAEAEDLNMVSDCSVDLVTVGQALHWFDLSKFYPEMSRILKKDGVIAVWGYDLNNFKNEKANDLLMKLYDDTLGEFWSDRRALVDAHLVGMEPKGEDWCNVTPMNTSMSKVMPFEAYLGYLRSWSAYVTYMEKNPDVECPVKAFGADLAEVLHIQQCDDIEIDWPIFGFTAQRS